MDTGNVELCCLKGEREDNTMKILITTDLYKPSINGVVTSITNLETELRKQGHEVRILTVSTDSSSHQEVKVY